MSSDDLKLLKDAQRGDIEAFEKLIEQYKGKVFNTALRMLANPADADDISQEVFIKVYKSIRKFKGQSSFSTWVYRIATNTCLDYIRKNKREKTVSVDNNIKYKNDEIKREIQDDRETLEENYEKKERIQVIKKAVSMLSAEHKAVIILRDIEGLSYDEIAEISGCPPGTVKSRISRARTALKNIIINNKELFEALNVK